MEKRKDTSFIANDARLLAEWDWEKNGDVDPSKVPTGSHRKLWWKCNKGHSWQAITFNRARGGTGCPVCYGRKVQVKYNDLATVNPKLASEWHPTKNGDLKPTDVTRCSNRKVWWKCEKGHEWQAIVNSRTQGHGCPHCAALNPIFWGRKKKYDVEDTNKIQEN